MDYAFLEQNGLNKFCIYILDMIYLYNHHCLRYNTDIGGGLWNSFLVVSEF